MEPVRCAVIGIGMIGQVHAAVLASSIAADLLVCCDLNAEVKSRVPKGVRFTTDTEEALDTPGLEAVFVCTRENQHLPVVRAAFERGLAVFCEKPIANSLEAADAMIALARETKLPFVVGHTLRFDPDYRAAAQAINSGAIGQVVHLHGRRNCPDYEGVQIADKTTIPLELAIHDLDVFRWVAGDIERVYAEESRFGVVIPETADAVAATVKFASGAVGVWDANWIMPSDSGLGFDNGLAVYGSKGTVYVGFRTTPVSIFATSGVRFPVTKHEPESDGIPCGNIRAEDDYFLQLVRDGRSWPVALGDVRAALVAALAMDRSIALGRPVHVHEMEAVPLPAS